MVMIDGSSDKNCSFSRIKTWKKRRLILSLNAKINIKKCRKKFCDDSSSKSSSF